MPEFTKLIEFYPAHDQKAAGGGIHGVDIRFVLKGPKGAVDFMLMTNWLLPETQERTDARILEDIKAREVTQVQLDVLYKPIPAHRAYHSPVQRYGNQVPSSEPCPYLDEGQHCFWDSSGLNADGIYEALLHEGDEGVWKELEYYYHDVFEIPMEERTLEGSELGVLVETVLKPILEKEPDD
jgi:hypothetical protein